MIPQVPNVLLNFRQEDSRLQMAPTQRLLDHPNAHPLNPAQKILHLEHADHLQPLILRPRVRRDLERPLHDTLEAGGLEQALEVAGGLERGAVLDGRLADQAVVLAEVAVLGERVVVAAEHAVNGLELDPAARLEPVIALRDELRPVADGEEQVPREDEVVGVGGPGPVLLHVVDLEVAVGRDPVR